MTRNPPNLILPPNYLQTINGPLIFLAGPIQGAYRWQDTAIDLINAKAPELYIASPRSLDDNKMDHIHLDEQIDWEVYHLKKAGETGCVLFWLAKEYKHFCERAYAQTSRFELGEWKMRHEIYGANLVVGIEDGFTNANYIMHRLSQDCPKVPITKTLEETCEEAIRLARMK